MKTGIIAILMFMTVPAFGQHAEDFYDPAAMAAARHHAKQMHGDSLNYLAIAERLENQVHDDDRNLVWEAQGWIGYDRNKL